MGCNCPLNSAKLNQS